MMQHSPSSAKVGGNTALTDNMSHVIEPERKEFPMRSVCTRVIGLALLVALAGSPARAQSSLHVWYEQDFAQNPMLAVQPHDVVVLDLEPGRKQKRQHENILRYHLRSGTHTFCLDADDPSLTDLILEDFQGRRIERL